jgi:two-component system chemotaxis response regulator CheY
MAYDLGRLSLLIVEPDEAMAGTWRRLLTALKIRDVRFLPGAAQARTLLASAAESQLTVDILICRWELPGEDGLALVRQLRRDADSPTPFLPAIIVTNEITRERVAQALQAGVHEILVPPLTPKAVEARLREIVERPRKFIRSGDYFGPDRRRQVRAGYAGPFRRTDDRKKV